METTATAGLVSGVATSGVFWAAIVAAVSSGIIAALGFWIGRNRLLSEVKIYLDMGSELSPETRKKLKSRIDRKVLEFSNSNPNSSITALLSGILIFVFLAYAFAVLGVRTNTEKDILWLVILCLVLAGILTILMIIFMVKDLWQEIKRMHAERKAVKLNANSKDDANENV
ncbi:MAG: hypothetical protein FWF45_01620 [Coriobacteriia bacterium]|nr:hypothetical protein [Coriobacteriia bacterium]